MHEEETILKETAKTIHQDAKEIEKIIKQQDLLIETISENTERNAQFIRKGKAKMNKAFEALQKDNRNWIILFLIILILMISVYLVG